MAPPSRRQLSAKPTLALGTLASLVAAACADWAPRPLRDYAEDPSEQSGVRRFHHHERHAWEDGSDMELQWEVHADPDSIFALDVEHHRGARVVRCTPAGLILQVTPDHADRAHRWRHVTASQLMHGCSHLKDNLYRKVLRLVRVDVDSKPWPWSGDTRTVELATQELQSPAEIFPYCSVQFRNSPIEAQDPDHVPQAAPRRLMPHKLSDFLGVSVSSPSVHTSVSPVLNDVDTIFNPNQAADMSKLSWNWDFNANSTRNPQFTYKYPGGVGYVKLHQPYLIAHIGIHINFTSHLKESAEVNVVAKLNGIADFNADVATVIDFKRDRAETYDYSTVPKDHLSREVTNMTDLENMTSEEKLMAPVTVYLGGVPFTIKPGFSCKLKAYHIGLLKGSLHVGLQTKMLLNGLMTFNTNDGMETNFSAKALNVKFTPPTWMLFTNHFEMGMMLEPIVWWEGGFGNQTFMNMGVDLRPFFNVSIMQDSVDSDTSVQKQLAVFPFRAIGLPAGRNYVVKIGVNGYHQSTANQMSTGVTEYTQSVSQFGFGMISEQKLLNTPIEVSIFEDGKELVGTGHVTCEKVVNGRCEPSPVTASIIIGDHACDVEGGEKVDCGVDDEQQCTVRGCCFKQTPQPPPPAQGEPPCFRGNPLHAGQEVEIHMAMIWADEALTALESQVKSVALRFPQILLSEDLMQAEVPQNQIKEAFVLMKRNGRSIVVPLQQTVNSTRLLMNRVDYELGSIFLDSWKSQDIKPLLELHLNGHVVATGLLPPLRWSGGQVGDFSGSFLNGEVDLSVLTSRILVPLYNPHDSRAVLATLSVNIDVGQPERAAWWTFPYQEFGLQAGMAYDFKWTIPDMEEGVAQDFMLTAREVQQNDENSLKTSSWKQNIKVACTMTAADEQSSMFHGDTPTCVFKKGMELPTDPFSADRFFVLLVSWLDKHGATHEMASPPVQFVGGSISSRRLFDDWQDASSAMEHDAGMSQECSAEPLKYSIGGGLNSYFFMHDVLMPGVDMGGGPRTLGFHSSPFELFKLGDDQTKAQKLSDIVPESVCAGGVCEGMMPGCKETLVNPMEIKQVVFRLSRRFRWKEHVGPKLRHIIAYALALSPYAIEISEPRIQAVLQDQYSAVSSALLGGHAPPWHFNFGYDHSTTSAKPTAPVTVPFQSTTVTSTVTTTTIKTSPMETTTVTVTGTETVTFTTTLVSFSDCRSGFYRTSAIVFTCGGGELSYSFDLKPHEQRTVPPIPKNTLDAKVSVITGASDIDVILYDIEQAKYIVDREIGIMNQNVKSGWYRDVEVDYSGKQPDMPQEIRIRGKQPFTAEVILKNRGYENVRAIVQYKYRGIEPCPQPLPGCSEYTSDLSEQAEQTAIAWAHALRAQYFTPEHAWQSATKLAGIEGIQWSSWKNAWNDPGTWMIGFKYLDTDNDGYVSQDEYKKGYGLGSEGGGVNVRKLLSEDGEEEDQDLLAEYDELHEEERSEFDTFNVNIVRPLHYDLTPEMLNGLLNRGAFNGLEDGQEEHHGPVFIKAFEMRDRPIPGTRLAQAEAVASKAALLPDSPSFSPGSISTWGVVMALGGAAVMFSGLAKAVRPESLPGRLAARQVGAACRRHRSVRSIEQPPAEAAANAGSATDEHPLLTQ